MTSARDNLTLLRIAPPAKLGATFAGDGDSADGLKRIVRQTRTVQEAQLIEVCAVISAVALCVIAATLIWVVIDDAREDGPDATALPQADERERLMRRHR